MATQPKSEPSTDDPVLTRLGGVEAQLTDVKIRLTRVEDQLTDVKTRLTGVETRLAVVEIDLAIIKSNYATKEDLVRLYQAITALEVKTAQMETRLIKWFIGTAVTLSAVVGTIAFSVARFIH